MADTHKNATNAAEIPDQGCAAETNQNGSMAAILSKISELEPKEGAKGVTIDPKVDATLKKSVAKELKKFDQELAAIEPEEAMKAMRTRLAIALHKSKRSETLRELAKASLAESNRKTTLALDEGARIKLAKSKLETLCRELQRQNKLIQDESRRSRETELKKREELSNQFQSTIDDVTKRLDEDSTDKQQKAEEHEELRFKLQNFMAQNDVRMKHFEKLLESKNLEIQLADAKLEQQKQIAASEESKALAYKHECAKLSLSEESLKEQLALYSSKFDEFQSALTQSNAIFSKHQKDTDQLTAKLVKLTKEKDNWQQRYNKVNAAVIKSAEERLNSDKETALLKTKLATLEKLCRALQAKNQVENDNSPKSESSASKDSDAQTNESC